MFVHWFWWGNPCLTYLYQTLVEPAYSALPRPSCRAKPRTPRDVQSLRVCEKALTQIYTDHCCGRGEEGREICHQNGEIVKIIVAGFSANGERLLLMLTDANPVLAFRGQNQKPDHRDRELAPLLQGFLEVFVRHLD